MCCLDMTCACACKRSACLCWGCWLGAQHMVDGDKGSDNSANNTRDIRVIKTRDP